VVVVLALGARLQRSEVAAGARLRVPLRPPVLAGEDARQEPLLLGGIAESHDHRTHHLEPERKQARSTCRSAFLLEDVLPHRIPPGATELLRPVRPAPAVPVQGLMPAEGVVAGDLHALEHLAPRLGGDVGVHEGADFVAEGELLSGEVQIHGARPPCASMFRLAKLCFMPRIRRSTAKTGLAIVPDRKFVTALGRGLDVLRCFGPRDRWLANQDIAARTGLARPTVSRLVYTLTQ